MKKEQEMEHTSESQGEDVREKKEVWNFRPTASIYFQFSPGKL
jgi:hypothetical protein